MSDNEKYLYEVIVIGAGIIGSATSYYLSKKYGEKVLLLEQFDFLHKKGSSHGETRLTRRTYTEEHYTFLMNDAYKLWEDVENEYGSKVYTKTGGLDISNPNNKEFQSIINSAKKYNVPIELLSSKQVTQKFPTIKLPEGYIGLYNEDGGILNATKSVAMFQCLARLNGCIMMDNTPVIKINDLNLKNNEGNDNHHGNNNNIISIQTAIGNQIYYTKKLIITVGPWAKKFLKQIYNIDLPLITLETEYSYWKINNPYGYSSDRFPILRNYSNSLPLESMAVWPAHEYSNMIKCAFVSGTECDPDQRTFDTNNDRIKHANEFLQNILIGVDTIKPTIIESCIYTMSPDENFIIDKILTNNNNNNIIIGCGFSGHGFKLAPVVGKILTQLAINGENIYPDIAKYFKLDRFK